MSKSHSIWCNYPFKKTALPILKEGLKEHQLLLPEKPLGYRLQTGEDTQVYPNVEIAMGQPTVEWIEKNRSLRWIHLTSAGYARFDTEKFRQLAKERGLIFTNSSSVFNEPCAQHILAMMLAFSRDLLAAFSNQSSQQWDCEPIRERSFLLKNQSVLILGFGAIAKRLVELLRPFEMKITAVKRKVEKVEGVKIITQAELSPALAEADHVINILPENEPTRHFCNTEFFKKIKPGAHFYNIGRGATVDQTALREALETDRLAAAYLDVTDPEPLSPSDPLWKTRNCFITPHTAGGYQNEDEGLAKHFLANFDLFIRKEKLRDVVFG